MVGQDGESEIRDIKVTRNKIKYNVQAKTRYLGVVFGGVLHTDHAILQSDREIVSFDSVKNITQIMRHPPGCSEHVATEAGIDFIRHNFEGVRNHFFNLGFVEWSQRNFKVPSFFLKLPLEI